VHDYEYVPMDAYIYSIYFDYLWIRFHGGPPQKTGLGLLHTWQIAVYHLTSWGWRPGDVYILGKSPLSLVKAPFVLLKSQSFAG